ncbi:MAG: SUKH-3 domain-containing protein [Myxococcales bacterium]|nr:SUKH-3 domain-containing protein [Myxococcales bacterium]
MSTEKQTNEQVPNQLDATMEIIEQKLEELNIKLGTGDGFTPRTEWPSLETTLKNSGWSPERRVNIASELDQLNSQGVKINQFAIDFISSFNELSITFPKRTANNTHTYIFNIKSSIEEYHTDIREVHERKTQSTLCPIGISEDKMVVLLIAETGKVYASVDTSLEFVANTYQEALIKLNRNEPFIDLEE